MTWHWFFHPKTILFISKSPVYQGFNRYLTVKPHEIHHIHLKASALGRPSSKLQFEASFELIRDEAFVGHELPTISAISRNHQKSLRLWSQIDLSWRAFEGPLKGLWRAFEGPVPGRGVFFRQPGISDCGSSWDQWDPRQDGKKKTLKFPDLSTFQWSPKDIGRHLWDMYLLVI